MWSFTTRTGLNPISKVRGNLSTYYPASKPLTSRLMQKKFKAKIKLKPETISWQKSDKYSDSDGDSNAASSWSLGSIKSLKTQGVSPHLESINGRYRLSHTDIGMAKIADMSSGNFVLTPRGQIDGISDLTVVTSGDGIRRGYYVQRDFHTDEAEIYSAKISDDGLTLTDPFATGITDGGSMAWGYPMPFGCVTDVSGCIGWKTHQPGVKSTRSGL